MVFKACRSSASPIATTTKAILHYYEYVNCKLKLYKKILFWYPTKFCTYCCNLPSNEFATFGFLKKQTHCYTFIVCVCVLVCMKYDTRMYNVYEARSEYVCMYVYQVKSNVESTSFSSFQTKEEITVTLNFSWLLKQTLMKNKSRWCWKNASQIACLYPKLNWISKCTSCYIICMLLRTYLSMWFCDFSCKIQVYI